MAHVEQKRFCEDIRRRFPYFFSGVRVLDIGSMDINGNNRYLFENSEYIGCDLGNGPNVDIVCAAHEYQAETESFDVVISTEALEHDRHLEKTLCRAVELVVPGGLLLLTCATGDRMEHGTNANEPGSSPFTNDYYQNVSAAVLMSILDMSLFGEYEFRMANGKDLYFYGIKRWSSFLEVTERDLKTGNKNWDWARYLRMNPDVAEKMGTDADAAYYHWITHGRNEGRIMYKTWPGSRK